MSSLYTSFLWRHLLIEQLEISIQTSRWISVYCTSGWLHSGSLIQILWWWILFVLLICNRQWNICQSISRWDKSIEIEIAIVHARVTNEMNAAVVHDSPVAAVHWRLFLHPVGNYCDENCHEYINCLPILARVQQLVMRPGVLIGTFTGYILSFSIQSYCIFITENTVSRTSHWRALLIFNFSPTSICIIGCESV